jgi:truncated hemoglobin YjbI
MVDTSDDLKQYFPAVLDGTAKHLKEFLWDL